jgi:hypothetical protein
MRERSKNNKMESFVEEIPNDGSFLELMKKRLAEGQAPKQRQTKRENSDDEEGPAQPPSKKRAITTQIFDIDDEQRLADGRTTSIHAS